MEVTIGQFATLVNSTVRTLRYYDKIGLLKPQKLNKNGRKVYTRADMEFYQQIMILKYFGLSLDEIKERLSNEKLNNRDFMTVQKQFIQKQQTELNDMLEVITRMERLYNVEGISAEELDEFAFIMLDMFRREKRQIQALEAYFIDDKEILKELKLLHDNEYKEKMDVQVWQLLQAIRSMIENKDAASRKKVREILNEMDTLFPANRNFLTLVEDTPFLARHNYEFANYFPEDIASYMLSEIHAYYDNNK